MSVCAPGDSDMNACDTNVGELVLLICVLAV